MVRSTSLSAALGALRANDHLYLPGASGEPGDVVGILQRYWPAGKKLAITTSFLPGVNEFDFSQLDPAISVTGLFMQTRFADAARENRYRHVPISYAAFSAWLDANAQFDATVVQVAPPDAAGRYSLGPSAEFTMQAIRKSRSVIAVVNAAVPRLVKSPSLSPDMISYICESDAPLTTYAVPGDELSKAVAARVAPLIDEGAVLQMGIGKIPGALLGQLNDRRDLQFWSGMISDGVMDLVEAGALRQGSIGFTCMCLGTKPFYDWLNDRADIVVHGCDTSHNPRELAALVGLVAVNGALEVDLMGQCNLERVNGRALSGAGGAPDFAHAARRGVGGKSIIVLPSEASGHSRIVGSIGCMSMTTLPRTEIDYVVTEHGVADLRFASVQERAERLVEVAAPHHRSDLSDAWREIAKLL